MASRYRMILSARSDCQKTTMAPSFSKVDDDHVSNLFSRYTNLLTFPLGMKQDISAFIYYYYLKKKICLILLLYIVNKRQIQILYLSATKSSLSLIVSSVFLCTVRGSILLRDLSKR